MFSGCKEFEFLDLSCINVVKVENMEWMFYNCNKLKEIKGSKV